MDETIISGRPPQTGGGTSGGLTDAELRATPVPVSATDLDIRNLSQTQDSVLIYGSDDGGTTKRVIKTDSGGAIQVDLEVASVAVTSFPDNEPFNVAQWGGNAVTGGAGAVASGTPRVTLASDDPAVASLSVLDDWDESDRAKTNPIVGQAGVQGGSGLVSANTQRVVLATDVALPAGTNNIGDVDVVSSALPTGASTSANQTTIIGHLDGVEGLLTTIDADTGTIAGAVSGTEMQVDVVAALPAGTNNIGDVDVASIAAGDNNIGNVDIVTVPAPLSTTGGGTEATALRVTIANDSTGVVSVDDNGSSLTVDGTVAVSSVGGTVTVTATNLDVQSGGADLATSAQGSAIQTAVELIDDTVATLGTTTYAEATTKGLIIGAVRRDADTTLIDTTNEVGPVQMNAAGQLKVEVFSGETLPVSLTSTTITGTVAVTQSGTWDEVGINDSGNSITVDATNLDIRDLTSASDSVAVLQATHDNLNLNANLQVANADVSTSNAVPTKVTPSDIDVNGSNANHADKYYTNAGAVTDGIVWSPAAGKRWHILTLYINVSAAATVTLEDDLAGGDNARWKGELAANSGVVLTYSPEHPFSSAEDAADLLITTTAGNVYVQAVGYEV